MTGAHVSTYGAALAQLYALQSRGIRMGMSRTRRALALRGHPDRDQVYVQVAGTNGKGSVSTLIAACLRRAGYRTGLFTSPHLHRYVERVRIDGRPLGEREASRRVRELLAAFSGDGAPETTFFELTTLLALEAFRDHACDISVLEVGLGGRLDATTAVRPALCVITGVALDHTHILGDSVAAIAREKAGIIKPAVPVVVGARDPSARSIIARKARRARAEALFVDRDYELIPDPRSKRFAVRVERNIVADLRIALPGVHQQHNAACAVAALLQLRKQGYAISDTAIRRGLASARWPARLEWVAGAPRVLFDAAHNPEGCRALAAFLSARPARGKRVLVFGAMADKAYPEMVRTLAPHFDRVFLCAPAVPRAAAASELRRHAAGARLASSVTDAMRRARRAAGEEGEVVVAGSIFLVAEARARVLGLRSDPLIRM